MQRLMTKLRKSFIPLPTVGINLRDCSSSFSSQFRFKSLVFSKVLHNVRADRASVSVYLLCLSASACLSVFVSLSSSYVCLCLSVCLSLCLCLSSLSPFLPLSPPPLSDQLGSLYM